MSARSLFILIVVWACLACAPTAVAGETGGSGYGLRLPDEFKPAPASLFGRERERVRTLVSGTGLPFGGDADERSFVALNEGTPEAGLFILRYSVPGDRGLETIDDIMFEAFEMGMRMTARELPDVEPGTFVRSKISPTAHGIMGRLGYAKSNGMARELRLVFAFGEGSCVILAMDAPVSGSKDYRGMFDRAAGSIEMREPDPVWREWIGVGSVAGGLLVVLLVFFVLWSRWHTPSTKRQNQALRSNTFPVPGASATDTSTGQTNETRAFDGLPTFTEPAPGARLSLKPEEPEEPETFLNHPPTPELVPEVPAEDEFVPPQVDYGSGAVPAAPPPAAAALDALFGTDDEGPKTEKPAGEKGDGESELRISRNDDFLA